MYGCQICGKVADLLKCGQCETARYCSKECQLANWPAHKAVCSKICRTDEERAEITIKRIMTFSSVASMIYALSYHWLGKGYVRIVIIPSDTEYNCVFTCEKELPPKIKTDPNTIPIGCSMINFATDVFMFSPITYSREVYAHFVNIIEYDKIGLSQVILSCDLEGVATNLKIVPV